MKPIRQAQPERARSTARRWVDIDSFRWSTAVEQPSMLSSVDCRTLTDP